MPGPITLPGLPPFPANFERLSNLTAGGQATTILKPTSYVAGTATPLVLWCHGYTEATMDLIRDPSQFAVVNALCAAGYFVAISDAHGNNWGNQSSVDDHIALLAFLTSRYTIDPNRLGLVGVSMGGLSSLNFLLKAHPNVVGWYGMQAASNLAEMYSVLSGNYATTINTAHGITGSSPNTYAEKTAGLDPALVAAVDYPAIRYRWTTSVSDANVRKTQNADALSTALSGRAIENTVVVKSGGHGDASHFDAPDVVAFFGRCFA